MRRSSPTVLGAAASPVRAWQEDVRSAAGRVVLPGPGDLLPALHVGVLLEPIDLAALIGPPERASSSEGPLAAPPAHHWGPAELRSAPRPPRVPPRRAAPPSAALLAADAGAPALRSGWSPKRWPRSPERLPAPVPTAAPGAGAARLAAMLQRYEAQEAVAASAAAAAGSFTPRALPEGSSPRSDRARTEPSRREPASPASVRGARVFVSPQARSAMLRSRLDADARGRTALASMEDAVGGRLRDWSQGIDVPPLPDPARSAADVARPTGPPATRPPSPGYSGTPVGAPPEAGFASAGRRRGPTAQVPASRNPAKLIDLVEQAVGDLTAVERRLPELGARDVARPTGPPATRPPSPGYSGTPVGAPPEAGFASAGRRRGPTAEVPASRNLAKLIDLVEQAVGDLTAVERRLAELGVREAPQVQWLEDDELAGRLQGILARQARQRGIDLS